jgi:GTP-binding protein
LLLHLVDIAPAEGDPVNAVRAIERELAAYSAELAGRERWLVPNKLDLIPVEERAQRVSELVDALAWTGPVHPISAVSGEGCGALVRAVMASLETARQAPATSDSGEPGSPGPRYAD